MTYIVIIFSFIFEAIMTNIVSINSLLIPLFTLVSLSLVYPYFKRNDNNFIIACGITGLFYDMIYTNTLFISTISFILISLIIILNYKMFKYNIFLVNIFNIFLLVIYRIISYLILVIIGYSSFKFNILLEGIYSSLIINILYGIVMYIIIDKISYLLDIKR